MNAISLMGYRAYSSVTQEACWSTEKISISLAKWTGSKRKYLFKKKNEPKSVNHLPLVIFLLSSSKNVLYELNTTGNMGTCPATAIWKAPFLNECISPVLRRVPSGKIHNLIFFFFINSVASHSELRALSDCMRSMKIKPHSQAANPNGHA